MTEKGAAGLSILVILLLWTAHLAYGYWTDRVDVREEFAVVWPLEVEIETEEDTEGEQSDDTEPEYDEEQSDDTEPEYDAEQADDGEPL